MPYSPVTVIGFNANPPPDDGTQVTGNEVAWAKHIEKIGDPLKTAIESIDSNVEDIILEIEADIATIESDITTNVASIASNAADIATNVAAIAALDARIDALEGVLSAPSGTILLFRNGTPPTGWTKQTQWDNYMVRVSGSTVSEQTGTNGFNSRFQNSALGTSATTLTASQMPVHRHYSSGTFLSGNQDTAHQHNYTRYNNLQGVESGNTTTTMWRGTSTQSTGNNDANHKHYTTVAFFTDYQGSGGSHTHSTDMRVNYVDFVVAGKD